MKNFLSKFNHILLNKPIISFVLLILLIGLSLKLTSRLSINSNQIDLLPNNEIEVIKTKEVIEMIGGNGFFILALKIKDEKGRSEVLLKSIEAKKQNKTEEYSKLQQEYNKLTEENKEYYIGLEKKIKSTADILYNELLKNKSIRYISYRWDTEFLTDRLPLFISSTDLREVRERVNKKIQAEFNKLNPFYINLDDEEYNPDFTDILNKYQRLAKRDIFDEYNISPDKTMLLLLVKPVGSFTDLNSTRELEAYITETIQNLKINEQGIHIAYTGTYKLNLDDYDSLVDALKPISFASLTLITILLILFFRNPIFILILVISLVSGVIFTFGVTAVLIGRLNTVTTVMAAVLMGLGIDYGIQFLYRFRDEFTLREDFFDSVTETIYHTGAASLISALTTTSAFLVLMFSDFKGFSEFGLIACYGMIIIAFSMYFVTALQISILFKLFPSIKEKFKFIENTSKENLIAYRFYKNPKLVLRISAIFIIIISIFSYKVEFNYSGRDLLLENQESLLVYDEIADRFDVSSDPQAIVVDTLEKSEAVFDFFNPVPEEMKNSVDQIVSIWNMVPPINQLQTNIYLLNQIKNDIKQIKPEMVKEEYKPYLTQVNNYLAAKGFKYEEVPDLYTKQFIEVPESNKKGHLLFIYPKVALWHGKDLISFYNKVGKFEYPLISKRTLNSLLYSHVVDFSKDHPEHLIANYSPEEEKNILESANTYSKEEMISLGILPKTAELIIERRPYNSVSQMRQIKDTAYTAGSVILFAKLALIVQKEALPAVCITLFLVFCILIIFYRGFIPALLSLFPLLIGLLVMLGLMGLTSTKVNFFNVLIFPIVIGYGIQNGIYIYYRFREEQDIASCLSKVGPAIIASTLTTLVGWGVLLIAEHRGLHSLGVVACIGIGSSLLVALTLLPSLLAIVYKTNHSHHQDLNLGISIDNPVIKTEDLIEQPMISQEEVIPIKRKNISKKQIPKRKKIIAKKSTPNPKSRVNKKSKTDS